jgi:hypothetical protein
MTGGPAMNVVLGFLLFAVVLMGFGQSAPTTTVAAVSECVVSVGSGDTGPVVCGPDDPVTPAAQAGFRPGDQIVSFEGQRIEEWDDLTPLIRANGGNQVDVVVLRDGAEQTLTPTLATSERYSDPNDPCSDPEAVGFLGVSPTFETVHLGPGAVAAQVGDFSVRTVEAVIAVPSRMVGVWNAAFGGEERDICGPVGVVGAGRIGGEIAANDAVAVSDRIAGFIALLASFNLAPGDARGPAPRPRPTSGEPADQGRQGAGRRRRPRLGAVDDHHPDHRRQRHAAADRRAHGHRLPHRAGRGAQPGRRRRPAGDRAQVRDPGDRRHPLPAQVRVRRDRRRLRRGAGEPGQHQAVRRQGRRDRRRGRDAGTPIRIGVNAGLARQAAAQEVRQGHARGAGRVRAVGGLAVRGARLPRHQDLGQAPRPGRDGPAYELLAEQCDYPLHLGVTEAGPRSRAPSSPPSRSGPC